MKQRFSSLDVKVIAHELASTLVSLRVSNIYDLSSKIFLIKFAKPDVKEQIVIDSGFRCHLTAYSRATAAAPSHFVTKLRKALKTRRVTSVAQIGTDRILELQFSDGQFRLYLEFFAGGNIILTDNELNILSLLRTVSANEGQEEQRVGLQYSLENRQNYVGIPLLTLDRIRNGLQKAVERGEAESIQAKKQRGKSKDELRRALAVSITEYPPMLLDHAMCVTNVDTSLKPSEILKAPETLEALLRSLEEAKRVVQEITSSSIVKGYIIAQRKDAPHQSANDEASRAAYLYADFHPFRPKQFEDDHSLTFFEFEGFNKTVDEFFSSIEGQKLESRLEERELHAKRKLESARIEQFKRLGTLQAEQEKNEHKAAAIIANVERVQETMDAVNGLIAQGMDWIEIEKFIEMEQKRTNPLAEIILLPLKLHENTITLLLYEEEDDGEDSAYFTDPNDSESEDQLDPNSQSSKERLDIDINLGMSPWANAREYYDQKRSASQKEQKTLQASSMALKSTEKKITRDLKKGLKQEKAVLRPLRTQMWFEKFTWFVSSDGYLVLAGKDNQQNEILYRRYLKNGDVYVHADLQGAATVIIRNDPRTPEAPIPPSTLSQAGTLAVASSSAWDSKAGMSAWWVNASQVSKSASAGEFLPSGSFMVSGSKNFLPPAQLLLGFGIMFHVSEESKSRHMRHRTSASKDVKESAAGSTSPDGEIHHEDHETSSLGGATDPKDTEEHSEEDEDVSSLGDKEGRGQFMQMNEHDDHRSSKDEFEQTKMKSGHPDSLQPGIESVSAIDKADSNSKMAELTLESNSKPDAFSALHEHASSQSAEDDPISSHQSSTKPALLKRGKKGKAKKIAQKYKDQDEEDRIVAQQILGSTNGAKRASEEAAAKTKRDAELAFQKERRRAQHARTQKATAEHEETRKTMLEDGGDLIDSEEEGKMTAFDALVGTPLPGDEILDAVPVCAPWAAMAKFKYKAKLQPGTTKKGKAVREILGKWAADSAVKGKIDKDSVDSERMWPREVDLLKNLKPEENTNIVPVGKLRVIMPGGFAGQNSGKKQSKGGKGSKKS